MITIIDYNMGNLSSVKNMIDRIGFNSVITREVEQINIASHIILPGVGSFDKAVENIIKYNLLEILNKKALKDCIPVLGICLGMQIMTLKSEEGKQNGLGWINAETVKFVSNNENNLKIPHMGWNNVDIIRKTGLFNDLIDSRFYFVHSYHVRCIEHNDIIANARYGYEFTCALQKDNIYGVQFHPEKSHKFGMKLLKNFCEL